MRFYIRVWVRGGKIVQLQCSNSEIRHNISDIPGASVYDLTVAGAYVDSDAVFGVLGFDGQAFTGLDVLSVAVAA